MRGGSLALRFTLMLLLGSLGCANRDIALRPPKRPEELTLPPVADSRFSNPPVYPEPINQNNDPMRPGNGAGPNLGAINGMGGMGGGGMSPMGMGGMGMGGGYGGGMGMGR